MYCFDFTELLFFLLEISFTAVTLLQVQMMKSTFGLPKMSFVTGLHVAIHGCTNKQQLTSFLFI